MKNTFYKDCTLLVNSCDSYSDCWNGFFKLLKIQWPDFDMNIVLNTESKEYSFEDLKIQTFQIYTDKKVTWGQRMIETLVRIKTKYIIFTLEDFYIESPVNVTELSKCYTYMEENPNIAYFSFFPTKDKNNIKSDKYPGFEKRPQKGEYRLNCQMALWNRKKLISYIRRHENPWEWELYGSKRSARYKEEFYTICEDIPKIFDYQNGGMIMRGRWYMSKVLPLCEKYNLNIDFSHRDSYENFLSSPQPHKRNLVQGIKNRINKIKSLI